MNKYIKLMITALIIITADQITKQIIISNLLLFESIPIIDGFFNLTYLRNPGGAFSLFASESVLFRKIIFKILPTIVILILCFFYKTIPDSCKFQTFGISLIISGAIANLIDRFYFGYVIDFLDFYIKDMHYPAFNIADSAISIGIIFFLIDILFDKRKD